MSALLVALLLSQSDAGLTTPPLLTAEPGFADPFSDAGVVVVAQPAARPLTDEGEEVVVGDMVVITRASDGKLARGVLKEIRPNAFIVETDYIEALEVPFGAIAKLHRRLGRDEDPVRGHYFALGGGLLPKKGSLTLRQLELGGSLVTWTPLSFLSVQAGTALPAWFINVGRSMFIHAMFGLRAGASPLPWLHVAAVSSVLIAPGLGGFRSSGPPMSGILGGAVTFGDERLNASVTVVAPFNAANAGSVSGSIFGLPMITVAGLWRVRPTVGVMLESWTLLDVGTYDAMVFASVGVRFFVGNLAFDLGLMPSFGVLSGGRGANVVLPPLPVFNVGYRFF